MILDVCQTSLWINAPSSLFKMYLERQMLLKLTPTLVFVSALRHHVDKIQAVRGVDVDNVDADKMLTLTSVVLS
jgi:hypothetical protein